MASESPRVPVIAIVGRPNVGKSTLLNALVGRRIAIEDPTPGTTRDRVAVMTRHRGAPLELVDTGGITDPAGGPIAAAVRHQVDLALAAADAVLFLVDARDGCMPADGEIAAMLRRTGKPVVVAVSKVDAVRWEAALPDFYALGFGDPLAVSGKQKLGLRPLMDRVFATLPEELRAPRPEAAPSLPPMKLAIVGRQNVGKSTLVNTLARSDRVIVSEIPGTTRDSVDVAFSWKGRDFVAIDTAGLRRKGKVDDPIEYHGRMRTEASIRRADVILFLVDASLRVTEVDKKIAQGIDDDSKPCVVGINKCDLVADARKGGIEKYGKYIARTLPMLGYAPISLLSGLERVNVFETVATALDLYRQAHERIPTARLNQIVERAKEWPGPRSRGRGRAKIYYATQVGVAPPRIVLFVNDPELFPADYRRNLTNQFRAETIYPEIPVRLEFTRGRGRRRPARPAASPTENAQEPS